MLVVSHDVIEALSQTRVIFQNPAETAPKSPAEVLGLHPGNFAQFRHVTAGTKQVLAESPHRPLTGIFVSAQWEEPPVSMKDSAALDI